MSSKKLHYVKRHCRTIKSGKKAKSPCTRNGKSGTIIKGHYSGKHSKKHSAATKIQAILRGRKSRRTKSAKKITPKHTSASKITALIRKYSKRRSAEKKKKAEKLAKALKKLA